MLGAEAFIGSYLQCLHQHPELFGEQLRPEALPVHDILWVGPLNKEPRIPQEIHCGPSTFRSGVGIRSLLCNWQEQHLRLYLCLGFLQCNFNWPNSSHYPNQSSRHACLQFGLHYLLGFFPFPPPFFFFFLEVGVLFNLKINCSLSVTELAIHLGWLHLQFTFRNPKIRMHFTLNFLIDCICTYFSKKLELLHLSLP